MASKKTKLREINIVEDSGAFQAFFKKLAGESKDLGYDGISSLRKLISNEKARMIHVIKSEKPSSMYELSKKLNRDFKSVSEDVKILERFGIIRIESQKTGRRIRSKPIISADNIIIKVRIS